MSSYVMIGTSDVEKSNAFYDAIFPTIGWCAHKEYAGGKGYSEGGTGKGLCILVYPPFNEKPASAGNGTMIGLMVKSRAEVDAFYEAAMENGATDEGAPGLRPHYGPNWYAAYLRDLTGNKIGVVFNG